MEILILGWRFEILHVSTNFTFTFSCFTEWEWYVRKVVSNIRDYRASVVLGNKNAVWISARTSADFWVWFSRFPDKSQFLHLLQHVKEIDLCLEIFTLIKKIQLPECIKRGACINQGQMSVFPKKPIKRIKIKYRKKQKVFIVMTQSRRPISQCFMWQELYSLRFGTFSFFFFFLCSSSSEKKIFFLQNLLKTLENTEPENKMTFVHSFTSLLCWCLVFDVFSFYKLSKTRTAPCSFIYSKVTIRK